jgi:hypothetical protein
MNPGQFIEVFKVQDFQALPTDDSHASKVVRAAAAFAGASQLWALELSNVETLKADLLKAQAKLDAALFAKVDAEAKLKDLVNGEPNGQS